MKKSNLLLLGSFGIFLWVFLEKKSQAATSPDLNYQPDLFNQIVDTVETATKDVIMGTTRGERNNNPGNLMFNSNINWVGQTGHDAGGYAVFDTPEHGLRAMFIDLKNKILRGLNTLNKLIPVYAPPSENPTQTYIDNVSAWTGFSPSQILSTGDVPALAVAMINMENGRMIYTQEQLNFATQSAGLA